MTATIITIRIAMVAIKAITFVEMAVPELSTIRVYVGGNVDARGESVGDEVGYEDVGIIDGDFVGGEDVGGYVQSPST